MFLTITTLRGNGCSCRCETFTINQQWDLDHAGKFSTWQHPAMGLCIEALIEFLETGISLKYTDDFHALIFGNISSACAKEYLRV